MVTRPKPTEATLRDYKARLLRVLVHIQEHLDATLGLAELASVACFSPYHFHRVFKGMLGESVKGHIRRLRLERAASQLQLSGRSVTQIALDAGYQSHEAFTRAFASAFGMAPSRYRAWRRARQGRLASAPARSGVHYLEGKRPRHFKTMRPHQPTSPVTIKSFPPARVAFVRHVGPYSACGGAWDRLCAFLGKEGWLGGDAQFIGLCHDDPEVTPPDKLRYDACVTVSASFQPQGEIGVQAVAGGEYAVTTHFGPYDGLHVTYERLLGQWLPRSGREAGDAPCFEVYLNSPHGTAPEDLLTDVHVPLRPGRRGGEPRPPT